MDGAHRAPLGHLCWSRLITPGLPSGLGHFGSCCRKGSLGAARLGPTIRAGATPNISALCFVHRAWDVGKYLANIHQMTPRRNGSHG